MKTDLRYMRAATLDEALAILHESGTEVAPLAGGTDLMVDLRAGGLRKNRFLDIARLGELKVLEMTGGEIHLGAGLTFSEILSSDLLAEHASVLQAASASVGSVQIRNVATIGGNVVHCSPCADSVPALLVHDARVVLSSRDGERILPLPLFLRGPYHSDRRPEELLTRFILRPADGNFQRFQKVARRRELAVSRLTLAVSGQRGEKGGIEEIRIALGSATPSPQRMEAAEGFLRGRKPDRDDLWEAGRILAQEMIGISGRRPSTLYKEKAVQGILVRALWPLLDPLPSPGRKKEVRA